MPTITDATCRTYQQDWETFCTWCAGEGACTCESCTAIRAAYWSRARPLDPLPARPENLINYLAHLCHSGKSLGTMRRHLAAIRYAHQVTGLPTPTDDEQVKEACAQLRQHWQQQPEGKRQIRTEDLRSMIEALPETVKGARDKALILIGRACAFRRADLIGLTCEMVCWTDDGMIITTPRYRRKLTYDPDLALCPVRALRAWLTASAITEGPLFCGLSGWGVARAIKAALTASGLDPTHYSVDSLHAGADPGDDDLFRNNVLTKAGLF